MNNFILTILCVAIGVNVAPYLLHIGILIGLLITFFFVCKYSWRFFKFIYLSILRPCLFNLFDLVNGHLIDAKLSLKMIFTKKLDFEESTIKRRFYGSFNLLSYIFKYGLTLILFLFFINSFLK